MCTLQIFLIHDHTNSFIQPWQNMSLWTCHSHMRFTFNEGILFNFNISLSAFGCTFFPLADRCFLMLWIHFSIVLCIRCLFLCLMAMFLLSGFMNFIDCVHTCICYRKGYCTRLWTTAIYSHIDWFCYNIFGWFGLICWNISPDLYPDCCSPCSRAQCHPIIGWVISELTCRSYTSLGKSCFGSLIMPCSGQSRLTVLTRKSCRNWIVELWRVSGLLGSPSQ